MVLQIINGYITAMITQPIDRYDPFMFLPLNVPEESHRVMELT